MLLYYIRTSVLWSSIFKLVGNLNCLPIGIYSMLLADDLDVYVWMNIMPLVCTIKENNITY
jgi:hypothetical protein